MRLNFFVILILFFSVISKSQGNLDSLKNALENAATPDERFETTREIGHYYYDLGEFDSALVEYNKAAKMVPYNDKKKKAKAILSIANTYNQIEDMETSIYYYKIVDRLYKQVQTEPEKVADLYKDLGRAYYDQAIYDSAMVYYMQAKEIYESNKIFNHDHGILYHYIGSVFKRQDNMDKACEYYQLEIDYGHKYEFPKVVADGFYLQGSCVENDTARLRHDLQALKLYEDLEDDQMIALMRNNAALSYYDIGMLDSAYYYMALSIEYFRDASGGSRTQLSSGLASMADIQIQLGKLNEAEKLLNEAEKIALTIDLKKFLTLEEIYGAFYKLNYKKGRYKEAADYLALMHAYEDSAMDQDHQSAIHEMELAYETEKKEAEIAKLEIAHQEEQYKKELAEAETAKESANKNIFLFCGVIVLILGGFAVYKWIESNKQKQIISLQKNEVEVQKELIEEKNKDIIDSMIYASSIQQAIITSQDYFANMFTDFFVLYKPRDIVSGDFYWAYQAEDGKKLIAVGDCTGHGVPGAMMSMLGTAFLNEVVIEGKERNPEKILEKLRELVKNAMSRKGGRDGMDMAFCVIDGNKLKFSGANLPVYVLRNGHLIELKGDKQPVGFQNTIEAPFTAVEMDVKKDDKIYLFSDGYADQFGGSKGKKYKYKTFRDKLAAINRLTFLEQKQIIDTEFETWKGDLEQLDDVCVIGVRV